MTLTHVTRAELSKLRTLPMVGFTMRATIVLGFGIAAALAAQAAERGAPTSASEAIATAVPFVQVGMMLLGTFSIGQEYSGGQYRTTLRAVPQRGVLAFAKACAAAGVLAATACVSVAASVAGASLTRLRSGTPGEDASALWGVIAGAVGYLTLIGMLAHAMTELLHRLVPALVATLALVLIVPPLVSVTEHARWLPSRAGELLYTVGGDTVLNAGTGGLVLVAWIVVIGGIGYLVHSRK